MVIGEAGESCAFYIADRLGMPKDMLNIAVEAAYGKEEKVSRQRRRRIKKELINKNNKFKHPNEKEVFIGSSHRINDWFCIM